MAENTINTLLVVVDTGIEEVDGIKAFMEKVDHKTCKIVVIDHHSAIDAKRVPTEWMDASLLTYDLPMEHPCKELCGAGLSGLVHMEIAKLAEESEQDIEPLDTPYDLMALGTIADMVPILGVKSTDCTDRSKENEHRHTARFGTVLYPKPFTAT